MSRALSIHLVTTTITIPHVLRLFRKYGSYMKFWIVGDLKTPHDEMLEFVGDTLKEAHWTDNTVYLSPDDQKHWKCSELIGWNCVQRRSIGFLEAIKDGADIIITHDTDNLPLNYNYFNDFLNAFSTYNGLQIGGKGWTDIGDLAFPRDAAFSVVQRGTPQPGMCDQTISFVTDAKVGLATGIILGSPDTSAIDRIAYLDPQVHQVSELLRKGIVLHPKGRAAVNSQNTAFLRQFAPAMFMAPGVGRGDDIVAGLLTQRIMRDQGYTTHFGQPFVFQQRHEHDLIEDLKAEMWLNENVAEVADFLDRMTLAPDVLTSCRYFWGGCGIFPSETVEAALAFLEDVEGVMK